MYWGARIKMKMNSLSDTSLQGSRIVLILSVEINLQEQQMYSCRKKTICWRFWSEFLQVAIWLNFINRYRYSIKHLAKTAIIVNYIGNSMHTFPYTQFADRSQRNHVKIEILSCVEVSGFNWLRDGGISARFSQALGWWIESWIFC